MIPVNSHGLRQSPGAVDVLRGPQSSPDERSLVETLIETAIENLIENQIEKEDGMPRTAPLPYRSVSRGFILALLLTPLSGFLSCATGESPGGQAAPGVSELAATTPGSVRPIVQQLVAEAEEYRAARALPTEEADFAERYSGEVPLDDIAATLLRRQHRDPFIDAYVRWQLTSFEPALPELTAPDFGRLVNQAPPYLDNPRADESTRQVMMRANDAGQLPARDLARLEEMYREIVEMSEIVAHLNTPAREFRQWVAGQLEGNRQNELLWLLEDGRATIAGGWPTRTIKTRITRLTEEGGRDPDFSRQERRLVAEHIQRLVGIERRMVNEVTFLADGSVNVTFSSAGITSRDANNWIDRLLRPRDESRVTDS